MKKISLALFFLLITAMTAQAAPLAQTQEDEKIPVDITSDNMVYNSDNNTVVFSGHVQSIRGEFNMWSEKLTIFLKPAEQKEDEEQTKKEGNPLNAVGNNDIERIVSEKNVRFKNGTQSGTSEKATYIAAKDLIILEGNPILHDKENTIEGNVIHYYVNENRSVVEGAPKKRVHAVFSSKNKDMTPNKNTAKTASPAKSKDSSAADQKRTQSTKDQKKTSSGKTASKTSSSKKDSSKQKK